MAMRYENFAENEHYHVFGRGVNGEKIFLDDKDRLRFIFLITHFQSPTRIYNISWYTQSFIKNGSFNLQEAKVDTILRKRSVKLIAFSLMSNHFHILVKNLEDRILSVYMHRILTAYGKYFNAKYKKRGHVFEGPFGAVPIKNNEQLLHLSAYIHKNAREIKEWSDDYDKYPWSSYQDYIGLNRWGNLLSPEIIMDQFKNQFDYKKFVLTSTAKENLF